MAANRRARRASRSLEKSARSRLSTGVPTSGVATTSIAIEVLTTEVLTTALPSLAGGIQSLRIAAPHPARARARDKSSGRMVDRRPGIDGKAQKAFANSAVRQCGRDITDDSAVPRLKSRAPRFSVAKAGGISARIAHAHCLRGVSRRARCAARAPCRGCRRDARAAGVPVAHDAPQPLRETARRSGRKRLM